MFKLPIVPLERHKSSAKPNNGIEMDQLSKQYKEMLYRLSNKLRAAAVPAEIPQKTHTKPSFARPITVPALPNSGDKLSSKPQLERVNSTDTINNTPRLSGASTIKRFSFAQEDSANISKFRRLSICSASLINSAVSDIFPTSDTHTATFHRPPQAGFLLLDRLTSQASISPEPTSLTKEKYNWDNRGTARFQEDTPDPLFNASKKVIRRAGKSYLVYFKQLPTQLATSVTTDTTAFQKIQQTSQKNR